MHKWDFKSWVCVCEEGKRLGFSSLLLSLPSPAADHPPTRPGGAPPEAAPPASVLTALGSRRSMTQKMGGDREGGDKKALGSNLITQHSLKA